MAANQELLNFQNNLRNTALGIRFGKELLTNPDGLSAETITKVLKAMGLKLPEGVVIAADAAQALITGHAAIDAYQTAETVVDYQQAITMSASSVQLIAKLCKELHWIDSDAASIIEVGYDICAIVGSAGTNVGAWIRLALAIGAEDASAYAEADFYSTKKAMKAYETAYKKQIENFTQSLKDLESGKVGIFGFLVANAGGSQLLFDNVITHGAAFKPLVDKFPQLNFLPVGKWTWEAHATASTWWGDEKVGTGQFSAPALGIMDPTKACDFLLNWMIWPSAFTYMKMRQQYLDLGKADLFNVALLALFEPNFYLKRQMPVLDSLVKYRISPYELGERGIFNEAVKQNAAIVSNFGLSKQEKIFTKAQLDAMDQSGDISPLLGNRLANEQLKARFDFGELQQEKGTMGISYGYNNTQYFDWRNMANFISVLDFMDMVYSDPDFSHFAKTSDTIFQYEMLPKIKDFKKRYEILWKTSMIRRVNNASLANVSYFLNAPIAKIDVSPRANTSTVFQAK